MDQLKSPFIQFRVLPWDLWSVTAWPSINGNCFLSAMTVILPFFKGNFFALAIIGTHSFNSFCLLSFIEFPAFGSSNFTYIVLQSEFDLISRCLTVPTDPLIYLSNIFILSVNITLVPTHNFNSAGKLLVWDRLMLSGIAMEHVFISVSFLLSWDLRFQAVHVVGIFLTMIH